MAETAIVDTPQETVCIQAARITDSFRDKDCIEDLRVYLTRDSQCALDRCTGARARYAELLHVGVEVSNVPFHRGRYSVDLTYYYRILADALMGNARPVPIFGLAVFSKRVVMYGGESGAKRFTSDSVPCCSDGCASVGRNRPEAIVEAVDPMILAAKVVDTCACCRCDADPGALPAGIFSCFEGDLVLNGEAKRLYLTLGQFSVVTMQRGAQLRVPALDCTVPDRVPDDSFGSAEESDPSELFSQIDFPVDSFFPRSSDA